MLLINRGGEYVKSLPNFSSYIILFMLSSPILDSERGCIVQYISAFIISVLASIVAYYICKWMDGGD